MTRFGPDTPYPTPQDVPHEPSRPERDPARALVRDILDHHANLLNGGNIEARNAVIIKSVALLVLAFGIPAVDGEPSDQEEAFEKLEYALSVIAEAEQAEAEQQQAPQ